MGTAYDTWATGLSSSRGSPGDNGSFCPAHKFSGKERVPGPASAACTKLAAQGRLCGPPWRSRSIRAPPPAHSFHACGSGKLELRAGHSTGGWQSGLRQELRFIAPRKPKDLKL